MPMLKVRCLRSHLISLVFLFFQTHVDIQGGLVLEVLPAELAHNLLPHSMKAVQVILDCIGPPEQALAYGTHQWI